MQSIMNKLQQWKKAGIISIFLILTFIAGNTTGFSPKKQISQEKVLSAKIQVVPSSQPKADGPLAQALSPVPTKVPITIVNNIIIPTHAPVIISQGATVTPFPATKAMLQTASFSSVLPNITSSPTPSADSTGHSTLRDELSGSDSKSSPSPTSLNPTATLTPTPISPIVEIDIDYAGQHAESTYIVAITAHETAWQAIQNAVGISNVQYTDYGGDLGIFITGFNGVDATSNQYYDFQVNGVSSTVGVSSYIVNNHDVLKFILTNS